MCKYLISPSSYKVISSEDKSKICNGSGSAGTPVLITKLLDNCYGFAFNYKEASNIHDYMYYFGFNFIDKIKADLIYGLNLLILFLFNLLKTICYILFIKFNLLRVIIYPLVVILFGWKAYYKDK